MYAQAHDRSILKNIVKSIHNPSNYEHKHLEKRKCFTAYESSHRHEHIGRMPVPKLQIDGRHPTTHSAQSILEALNPSSAGTGEYPNSMPGRPRQDADARLAMAPVKMEMVMQSTLF